MSDTLSRAFPLIGLLALAACSDKTPPAAEPAKPVEQARPSPAAQPAPPVPDTVAAAPRPAPGEELIEPSTDLGGVLPLKHGIFVASDVDCGSPPFAALRRYDGVGLSGAHTHDCRATVLSRKRWTNPASTRDRDRRRAPASARPS